MTIKKCYRCKKESDFSYCYECQVTNLIKEFYKPFTYFPLELPIAQHMFELYALQGKRKPDYEWIKKHYHLPFKVPFTIKELQPFVVVDSEYYKEQYE